MNAHQRNFDEALPDTSDVERALLGTIIQANDAYWRVSGFLKPEHFGEAINAEIFSIIGTLITAGRMAIPPTIIPYLPAGEGQATASLYVAEMTSDAMPAGQVHNLALTVVEAFQRRMGIARMQDGISLLRTMPIDGSPAKVFDEVRANLDALSMIDEAKDGDIARVVDGMLERMTALDSRPTVPFPLSQLSEIIGGDMEAGNLYGMLSSSGEGKTSLALQIMDHAASKGHPVVLLSYDQSGAQCVDQIASQRTGIENTRIRNKTLQEREAEQYLKALADIKAMPLFIRKCSSATDGAAQLQGFVRALHSKKLKRFDKPALVVLDHSRKVKPVNPNAHEGRIAAEANGVFKQCAADLGLVWFNLMQRSSSGTKRKNPRPMDSDIYGGESGREDYDAVFYLYRGFKYWKSQLATADDEKDEGKINARFQREKWLEDEAEVGALKARFADPSRYFRLRFEKEFTRYVSKRTADEDARMQPELLT